MNILQLKRNNTILQQTLLPKVQETVLKADVDYIEFIQTQLYKGQDRYGNKIRPSYLEDYGPGKFLKTRAQAIAYAKWKAVITKNKDRDLFTPNLFINGFFYSSLKISLKTGVGLGAIYIESSAGFANEIFSKYGQPPFALQKQNKIELVEVSLRPVINKYIIQTLSK